MLATHNSLTYAPARRRWLELFSPWWRCQEKTLKEQYADGVRFFDIRVRRSASGWAFCHGLVDLRFSFDDFPDKPFFYRLVLERGGHSDRMEFAAMLQDFRRLLPTGVMTEAVIKSQWQMVYRWDGKIPGVVDKSYTPVSPVEPWWRQLRGLLRWVFVTPRSYAEKNNTCARCCLPDGWRESAGAACFFDFYNI